MNWLSRLIGFLFGRNPWFAPKQLIVNQMNEKRRLPIGMTEWDEWAERIISGTLLPADHESMKFALGTMILHLGPTESHKEDAFFIHSLLKSAANQVADAKMREIQKAVKTRLAAEEAARLASEQAKPSEVTQDLEGAHDEHKVLVKPDVQEPATTVVRGATG